MYASTIRPVQQCLQGVNTSRGEGYRKTQIKQLVQNARIDISNVLLTSVYIFMGEIPWTEYPCTQKIRTSNSWVNSLRPRSFKYFSLHGKPSKIFVSHFLRKL